MKKIFFVLSFLSLLVVLSPISLADLTVDFSERGSCMVAPHTFELNITNDREIFDTFYVKTSGAYNKWAWVTNKLLQLEAGGSEPSEILILPPQSAKMGQYNLDVVIQSRTNNSIRTTRELCFIVFRNYSMSAGNFSLSKDMYKPGEDVKASIYLENTGSRDFKNISFSIRLLEDGTMIKSSFRTVTLDTDERKKASTSVRLGDFQDPKKYTIDYKVKARGSVFSRGQEAFRVESVEKIDKESTTHPGVLGSTQKTHITNVGNSVYSETYRKKIGFPHYLLVSAEGAKVDSEGLTKVYRWDVEIQPNTKQTIQYRLNYWPVYIIIVVIAFLIYRGYLYMQVPDIKKSVRKTEVSEDERIFTISLEIKNRLFGQAEDVVVEDSVPSVARVIEKFDTLEPDLIKGDEETKLRWKIGRISPGDERVIHYKVKTLVEAVDYLKLPKAAVKGKVKDKEFERKSSGVRLEV